MKKMMLAALCALLSLVFTASAQNNNEIWSANAAAWRTHASIEKMNVAKERAVVMSAQYSMLPTDRDVILACGYDGVMRAVWGSRSATRVDSMTIVVDQPGHNFERCGAVPGGVIFGLTSVGLERVQDAGQVGFASIIDTYPSVGYADAFIPQASNAVTLGNSNNPYVLQHTLDANQVSIMSANGLRTAGNGMTSGVYLNNGDLVSLDINSQNIIMLRANSRQSEVYWHVPTSNAVAVATNDQKNQVYVLLAYMPGSNQTCQADSPCQASAERLAQIVQLQSSLGPQGPFVNAKALISGGMLNGVWYGPHTFFVSKSTAYVSIFAQSDGYHDSGNEIWAFDFNQPNAAYTFLPREFAPSLADAALYPVSTANGVSAITPQ